MNNTIYTIPNKTLKAIMLCCIVLTLIPLIAAAECYSEKDFGLFCDASEAFENNPTYDNFILIEKPTLKEFHILNHEEQGMYLSDHTLQQPPEELVVDYLQQTDFSKLQPQDFNIAQEFFTKESNNVNGHKDIFVEYMAGEGVVINLQGDLESFSKEGTIKLTQTDTQINLHAFKDKYTFTVTNDGELKLKPKATNQYYAVQGTITKSENGNLRMLGDGRFNGVKTKNVYELYIDEQGRARTTTEQFGSLAFEGRAHVIYEQKNNREYYTLKQAQLKGKDYELTGQLFVENEKSYTPQGQVLTITPYQTKDKEKTATVAVLSDTGYIVKAQNDNVEVDLDKPWQHAVKDFIADLTDSNDQEEKNRVRFSEQRLPLLESKTKEADEPADYRFEVDTATIITAEAAAKEGIIDKFMKLPSRGYYKLGDSPPEDSAEFNTINTIQEIVGLPAQNGVYDQYTKEAVRAWQKTYNEQHSYTIDNKGYLTPDGFWGKDTRTAYYRELPQDEVLVIRQSVPEIAIEPKGARVAFENTNNGVKISLNTGLADIELAGLRFRAEGEIQGVEGLKEKLQQRLKTPVTISIAVDEEGNPIQQDELVVFDKGYQYKTMGQEVLDDEIDLSCAFRGVVKTQEVACATLVTEYANLEAGGRYVTYNFNKDGKQERLTRVQATGEGGSAWEMAGNVIKTGGTSLFWVKDQELPKDSHVVYDYEQMQEGDIIGLYNTRSTYLDEAKQQGKLGRDYTHVVKVVGKETNVYQPGQGTDLKTYLQQELGITTPRILASYPVFIEDANDNNILKRAYLTPSGSYYFEDQLGEQRTPKAGVQPIALAADTSVMVDRPIITQLYHGQILTGDLGQFLERNPGIYLNEHLRPNEEIVAQTRERQMRQELTPVQVTEATLEEHFREAGVPEQAIPKLAEFTRTRNGLDDRRIRQGQVLFMPDTEAFVDKLSFDDVDLSGVMYQHGIKNSREVVDALYKSAKERAYEYQLTDQEVDELAKITAYIGMQESTWGNSKHPVYGTKFRTEQAIAEVTNVGTDLPAGVGSLVERAWQTGSELQGFSAGYLQTQTKLAREEAERLGENDYQGTWELATLDGSVKHGMRPMARFFKEYTTTNMPFEEKALRVAAAYHYGEEYPERVAFQQVIEDVSGEDIVADGFIGKQTLTAIKTWSEENNVPLVLPQDEEALAKVDFSYLKEKGIYDAVRSAWQEKYNSPPPDIAFPSAEERAYLKKIMEHCQAFGGGCVAVS